MTIEEKPKRNQLINFKHAKYDQKPITGKQSQKEQVKFDLQQIEEYARLQRSTSLLRKPTMTFDARSPAVPRRPRKSIRFRTQSSSLFQKQNTIDRWKSRVDDQLSDETSVLSVDSLIPEHFLTADYNTKQTPWFQKLDWKDDRKYHRFGKDQSLSHTVTRKQNAQTNFTVDPKLKEASALARLVEKSRKTFEKGFNQTAIR